MADAGLNAHEVIFTLPIAFQIHRALRPEVQQARVVDNALLHQLRMLRERLALVPAAFEVAPQAEIRSQPLGWWHFTARAGELLKHIL